MRFLFWSLLAGAMVVLPTPGADWPCFRGPDRMGIAATDDADVPLHWSDSTNTIWAVELPGHGASSPIVWRDNVYVTTYSGYGLVKNDPHENMPKLTRHLLCFDRRSGAVRWKADEPVGKSFEHGLSDFGFLHGYASSTPVADDNGVYVYLGRGGIIAHDHTGRQLWKAPIGGREHNWGSASSPIVF